MSLDYKSGTQLKVSAVLFDGNNYPEWLHQIQVLAFGIQGPESLEIMKGTKPRPTNEGLDPGDLERARKECIAYDKINNECYTIIYNTLKNPQKELLHNITIGDGQAAYKHMQQIFEPQTRAAVKQLLKQLLSLKQHGKPMAIFTNEIVEISSKLHAAIKETKLDLMDLLKISVLLDGIDLEHHITKELLIQKDDLTFQDACTQCITRAEIHSYDVDEHTTANAKAAAGESYCPICFNAVGKKHPHTEAQCYRKHPELNPRKPNGPSGNRRNGNGKHQRINNHNNNNNNNNNTKNNYNKPGKNANQVTGGAKAWLARARATTWSSLPDPDEGTTHLTFDVDSAASHTFVTDSRGVADFNPNIQMDVAAAGQTIHRTSGSGYIGEHLPIGRIPVAVAPDFDTNLLSVAQLTKQGVNVEFTDKSVIIKDRATAAPLYTGPRVGDSYQMRIKLPHKVHTRGRANFGSRKDTAIKHLNNKQLIMLWHRRLPHPSASRLHRAVHKYHITGTGINVNTPIGVYQEVISQCAACAKGKARLPAHHRTDPPTHKRSTAPGERLHYDEKTINKRSYGYNIYTGIMVDDYSRKCWSLPMRTKADSPAKVATFQQDEILPNQWNTKVFRMDRAGEHTGDAMKKVCAKFQIKPEFNSPGDSRGNGVAERHIEIVEQGANTYRVQGHLPVAAWAELYNTTCVGINYLPNAANPDMQSATQMLRNGQSQDVSFMRTPGCKCMVFTHPKDRRPQEDRGVECRFLGYDLDNRCYRAKPPGSARIMESKYVTFFEDLDDLGEFTTDSESSECSVSEPSHIEATFVPTASVPASPACTSEPVNTTPQSVPQSTTTNNEHIVIPHDLAPFLDPALVVHGTVDNNLTIGCPPQSQQPAVVTQSQPFDVNVEKNTTSVSNNKSRRGGRGVRFQGDSLRNLSR